MKAPLFLLASSHMDREWYLPMDCTRVFFARVLDRAFELLEKKKDFRFFTDGQTSVVLDYLEARPDRKEAFLRYVREGRLQVGPWHVQSDERIPAGESHIRNLLMGKRESEELGGRMMLGYLPDDFGHISQTPQILRQFGMNRAFLMRGVKTEESGREFIWKGADGSEVFCISCEYGNGSIMDFEHGLRDGIRLIRDRAEFEQKKREAENAPNKVSDFSLLILSSDCQTLPEDLDRFVTEPFNTFDEVYDYAEKCRDRCRTKEGELKESGDIPYLQDTLASRIYLKTENAKAQSLLIRFAEPLNCLAEPKNLSDKGLLRVAWKYLVENHTHDGITGCHGDATADELMSRFEKCESLSGQLRDFAMEDMALRMDTSFAGEQALCVFHPRAARGNLFTGFKVRVQECRAGNYIRLYDRDGREAPVTLVSRRRVGSIRSNKWAQQMFTQVIEYEGYARFEDLPGMGMKVYRVEMCEDQPIYSGVTAGESFAENAFVRLEIAENGLRLFDKRNGRVYEGLAGLLDRGNKGDAYHFEPDGREKEIPLQGRLLECDGATARFEITGGSVKYIAVINAWEPAVYIRAEIDNREKDHALFARFPTGITDGKSFRDQPFILENGDLGVQPTQTFIGIEEDGQGLAVLHKGLHRAEFHEDGEMRLTLLQCQGRLYGGFFPDNYNDEYNGCQVLGKVETEFAIWPLNGGEDLFAISQEYSDGVACFPTGAHAGKLGPEVSFMEVEGAVQSSLKREEEGERLLARIYNPKREAVKARVKLPEGAKNTVRMRLDETELGPLDGVTLPLGPGEIATVAFEYGGMA